jgi:YbgC/YbaW family acyl-CoA thioester hydrolase
MATPRIRTEIQVMFFDTDCAGVVHNIAYLRFIEVARTLLGQQIGMGLDDMSRTKEYPVVVRTEIDYQRPATLGDTLIVDGWLDSFSQAKFWCAFELRRRGDDTLLVKSRQSLALVRMPEGRPVRLPAVWRDEYSELATVGR